MAFLSDGDEEDTTAALENKTTILASAVQMRDQLYESNMMPAVKVIGGIVIGMFFLYRFLLK